MKQDDRVDDAEWMRETQGTEVDSANDDTTHGGRHLRRLGALLLAGPLGGADDVGERGLGLLPAAGLEAAVRVDEEQVGRDLLEHLGDALLDLVLRGHARRVDVVDAGLRARSGAIWIESARTPIWLL